MRTAVAQQARNSAGSRGPHPGAGVLLRLLVFQRQLVLHLVGDHLLHLGGEHRLPACRAAGADRGLGCLLMRRVGGLQILRDDIVRQPEGGRGVHRIRLEVVAVEPVPGIACPSPSEGDRRRPRVVGPSVKARGKVEARSIDVQKHPAVAIAAVVAVVFMAMVEVSPPGKIVAVVVIAALHISATAPLGHHAAAVMALHRDSASAAQVVMDVHPPPGVMHVAHPAVGAGAHRAAALGDVLVAALGRGALEGRVAGTAEVRGRVRSRTNAGVRACTGANSRMRSGAGTCARQWWSSCARWWLWCVC